MNLDVGSETSDGGVKGDAENSMDEHHPSIHSFNRNVLSTNTKPSFIHSAEMCAVLTTLMEVIL